MEDKTSIKNFSYLGMGRIFSIAFQALFYLLLAAFIEPEIFGELHLILALAGTFSIFSLFGLKLSIQVSYAKKKFELADQITTLFVILTSVAALILILIEPIAALLCVSLSFFAMARASLLGLSEYKKYMYFSMLKSGTFFVIPFILYFTFDIPGIILGMAISNFIGSIPFFKRIKITKIISLKNHYKVLLHNFGVNAGSQLPDVLDKLVIVVFFSFFVVGVYQFNLQVLIALSVLPGVLGQFLISEESKGIGHKKLSYLIVFASIILAIISIFLAPILVPIFYSNYTEGIEGLQIMVIAIIPRAINAIYGSKLIARESTVVGYTAIVRIGSLLILLSILGQLYGLVGLALAVLISISATTLFTYILFKRSEHITPNT